MIYNFKKPKRKLAGSSTVNANLLWQRALLIVLIGFVTITGFFSFPISSESLNSQCESAMPDFLVSGRVVALSDVNVEVQILNANGVCPQSIVAETANHESDQFAVYLPYTIGEAPLSLSFRAEGYTPCSFEYRPADASGMQFDVELTDIWSITVTEMTLLPPRYLPQVRTLACE